MNCLRCDNEAEPGKALCQACLSAPRGPNNQFYSKATVQNEAPELRFAGFWLRVVANIIDYFAIGLMQLPIVLTLGYLVNLIDPNNPPLTAIMLAGLALLFVMVLFVLIYALFDSSRFQGPPGKMIVGLQVVNEYGARIHFGQALIRTVLKSLIGVVPGLLLVLGVATAGSRLQLFLAAIFAFIALLFNAYVYIMAGFTPQKQTLYDKWALTTVVKGPNFSAMRVVVGIFLAIILSVIPSLIDPPEFTKNGIKADYSRPYKNYPR